MSKRNKLFDKLINKIGWEAVLYDTLKGIYNIDGAEQDLKELHDEVQEVLEAYEEELEIRRGASAGMENMGFNSVAPVASDETAKPAQPDKFESHRSEPIPSTNSSSSEGDDSKVDKGSVVQSKPKSKPKKLVARVSVDEDAGACQGELPVPGNHRIVRRDYLTVLTKNDLQLGRGSKDGQVRGEGVSGLIRNFGRYDLVFKDNKLGVAFIHYEVILDEVKQLVGGEG